MIASYKAREANQKFLELLWFHHHTQATDVIPAEVVVGWRPGIEHYFWRSGCNSAAATVSRRVVVGT